MTAPKEKPVMTQFTSPEGHPRDRILIHQSSDIPKEGQFLSLNGYPFLAKPNTEIDLPRPVINMLETRIRTETQYDEEGEQYTIDIPRITFTVIKRDVTGLESVDNVLAT